MSDRKLVMEEHDGNVLVGVTKKDCDPFIRTVVGDIEAAIQQAPTILTEAEEKWAVNPKNPTYVPPKPEKKAVKPAAPAETKTENLPLLSGKEKPEQAKETTPAAETAPEPEKVEEKPAEETTETTEPRSGQTETEPETPGTEIRTEATSETETTETEEADVQELSERIASAPAPQHTETETPAAAPSGDVEYWLDDGRGPYDTVQDAMESLGLDKNTRPQHNRWDRLSRDLKEKIQRRPKSIN